MPVVEWHFPPEGEERRVLEPEDKMRKRRRSRRPESELEEALISASASTSYISPERWNLWEGGVVMRERGGRARESEEELLFE